MFQSLICSGDSFTSGYGLADSAKTWPHILANKLNIGITNLAREGMGNEYIIRSIIDQNIDSGLVICGFTHPSRAEFIDAKINKIFTTIPFRRGQTDFENMFWNDYYDELYYYEKFVTQVKMFSAYLKHNNIPYLFFDAMPIKHYYKNIDTNYLWFNNENMCSITYPHKLPDGHPNEIAHEKMAERLYKIITI